MLALEKHRARHGVYPASLSELVPAGLAELPPDPWSGRDFCYRLENSSYVLYSVGADLQDDHGKRPSGSLEASVFQGSPNRVNPGFDAVIHGPGGEAPE